MNIPKKAKQVFHGVMYDVYQWPQKMFDGSTATFEAIRRPDTVQVVGIYDGKILCGRESQPDSGEYDSFFGGRMEQGEDPLGAAKREFLEEAGMESDRWELYRVHEIAGKIQWKAYIYIARDCRKTAVQKLDAGERIAVQELAFEEWIAKLRQPQFRGREVLFDLVCEAIEDPDRVREWLMK